MCPVCIASAAWVAVSVASTGGLAAVALKKFNAGGSASKLPAQPIIKEDHHGEQHH